MNELYHHGVKGMKWGVRRYQNKDGSLTPAGKKKYGKMSDDKLRETLYKQVKRARSEQSDWSEQWRWDNTIGENSKAVQDKFLNERKKLRDSDAYKQAEKKLKRLDNELLADKIEEAEYFVQRDKIWDTVYRPELDSHAIYTNNGRQYVKEYLDSYGKDLNMGYLKDLGYNDRTARELNERVLRSKKKMLNS